MKTRGKPTPIAKAVAVPSGRAKKREKATPVAKAVAVPFGQAYDDIPMAVAVSATEKQGSLCCGCCCDYRRAVIAVEIIAIIWSIFPLGYNYMYYGNEENGWWIPTALLNIIVSAVNILAAAVGIAGALKFNTKCLAVAAAWDAFLILYMIIRSWSMPSRAGPCPGATSCWGSTF